MRTVIFLTAAVFLIFSCGTALSLDQSPVQTGLPAVQAPQGAEWVRMINPAENAEVIGKRPQIKAEFIKPVQRDKLLVTLDGTDVTQLAVLSESGFAYSPVVPLAAGSHTLVVMAVDASGASMQKILTFKSRHSEIFEEASSNNDASVIYTQALVKPKFLEQPVPQTTPNQPPQPPTHVDAFNSKIEGNLKSDNKLKNGEWEFTLNGNLRYFDQDVPSTPPLTKGFDVANWLLTGTYTKDALKVKASMGDIQVNETPNTINLSRKGGLLQFDYDIFQLKAFSLKNMQTFGIEGGMGIGLSNDDHILGVSAGVKLFNKKVEFKTIYVTGEDAGNPDAVSIIPVPGIPPDPFGTSNQSGVKEGNVLGFVLTSDFFDNKLKTELEADFSRFDTDASDEFGKKNSSAYLARAYGVLGKYNYDAKYEYFGRDYGTVGNLGSLQDREGPTVTQGLMLDKHMFLLNLSSSNDNVNNDPLFARIYQYTGGLNYTFTGIANVTLGLGYQRSLQESWHEPAGTPDLDMMSDTLSANISYIYGKWVFGVMTMYSLLNDRTFANADTTTMTVTFTPAYTLPSLTVGPMFSLNRTKSNSNGNWIWTDTYTAGLNIFAKLYRESKRVFWEGNKSGG